MVTRGVRTIAKWSVASALHPGATGGSRGISTNGGPSVVHPARTANGLCLYARVNVSSPRRTVTLSSPPRADTVFAQCRLTCAEPIAVLDAGYPAHPAGCANAATWTWVVTEPRYAEAILTASIAHSYACAGPPPPVNGTYGVHMSP